MQVKLIALAVAGLMAAPAFAQSNVTVYGRVDMAYTNLTNDDKGSVLEQESSNRWGLMGEEDLGGGLKAFFQLENRFWLDNGNTDPNPAVSTSTRSISNGTSTQTVAVVTGASATSTQWKDKAWVGLSGGFGKVYLGRNASVGYALYGGGGATSGGYESFGGDTIGSFGSRRGKVVNIWNNSVRYDSPVWGGFQAIGTYSFNEEAAGGKAAYALGGKLGLAGFRGELVFQKDVGDAGGGALVKSRMYETTYLTAGYAFGSFDLFGGYAISKGYSALGIDNEGAEMVRYQIGVKVPVGKGVILANIGRGTETTVATNATTGVKTSTDLSDYSHIGLGYWHLLSKRTILMANMKYDRQQDQFANGEDNQAGLELAIRHSF